ncbi:MAG TPA: wax ester/triacylglycerol synthase family O-acyltransferase [Solirubrobacteraceae bacterium]|nr:wax ester/triacylglycerol synthase family O-acyltransferase [Solirubrobacteraceae bacterium]
MSNRFTGADAAWLHMDRATNLMVITSVSLFDRPVDWERVKQIHQARVLDRYPRFHQRVVESRLPLRSPKWEEDPDFALEHHLHHIALPPPGDERALQELLGDLMTMPLDHSRPLWQTYMVDGFGEGAAMISRIHHCIGDGVSLARVMLSLTDSAPDAGIERSESEHPARALDGGLPGVAAFGVRVLSGAGSVASAAVRQGFEVVASPSHGARLAGAVVRDGGTALRLVMKPADAHTALKGDPGLSRRVAWTRPIPLPDVQQVAHANDATVNDVLLAAVSGALRHYLQERGSRVGEIQAMVPVNLRPLDQPVPRELGNKFGLVFLPLPVGVSGSYRRLIEVHKRMDEIKDSREGVVSYRVLGLAGHTPEPVERRVVDIFSGKGTAVMTNVVGPKEPVYMAGTRIKRSMFWAPTSGHIGMSISIFSYCGEITIGLMVDAGLVSEPSAIIDQLERELEFMRGLSVARVRRPRRPRSPSGSRRSRDAHPPSELGGKTR